MPRASYSWLKWSIFAVTVLALVALTIPLRAQDAAGAQQNSYVDDWSHHHLIFSNPGTRENAAAKGKLAEWESITGSPRFQMQQLKRGMGTPAASPVLATGEFFGGPRGSGFRHIDPHHPGKPVVMNAIAKDWTQPLGGDTTSLTITVGSLSSSSISSNSSFTVAGVTFDASPPTAAYQTGTFSSQPTSGNVTITDGSNTLTLTVGAESTTTITFPSNPSPGDTVTIGTGGIVYQFESSASSCSSGDRCVELGSGMFANLFTDYDFYNAITGACYNTCPTSGNDPNVAVTYTLASDSVTVINSTSTAVNLQTSDDAAIQLNGTSQSSYSLPAPTAADGNGCASSTTGTFLNEGGNSSLAAALATAIASCAKSFLAVGVTASNTAGSATLTVSALTPGSAGSSIGLGGTLNGNGLTWAGTTLSLGGSNGTTSGTATPPTFAYWNTTTGNTYASSDTVAANIYSALAGATHNTTTNTDLTVSNPGGTSPSMSISVKSGGPYSFSTASFSALTPEGNIASSPVKATVQPNAYPAEYGANPSSASCSDFVVYPTGQVGGAGASTIIAYTNIYSSCTASGAVPTVAWAFNTGTGYAVTTSPIIVSSTEIVFVESTGSAAQLVVLRLSGTASSNTGTLTSPGTISAIGSGGNVSTCATLPCYATLALPNGADDTYSSPYYTFNGVANKGADTLFVGTNTVSGTGTLAEIAPVVSGALGGTIDTAVTLTGAADAASPIQDPTSGCVFVGDVNGTLYSVDAGFGTGFTTCNSGTFSLYGHSANLANASGEGIYDGPIVDPSAHTVYAFVTDSGSVTATTGSCTANGGNCVVEFGTATITKGSTSANPIAAEQLGGSPAAGIYPIFAGAFDNVYFASTNGTGNLYAVGNTGTSAGAALYQIPISAGTISGAPNSPTAGQSLSAGFAWPSPVTEFCNNGATACVVTTGGCGTGTTCTTSGTDLLFFSVNRSAKTGCTATAGNGCVLAYNVADPILTLIAQANSGLNVTTPASPGCWATGGLVIDNSDQTTGGASQIYFINYNGTEAGAAGQSPLTSTSCGAGSTVTLQGVQASQFSP